MNAPTSSRHLTTREKIILLEGGKLHGSKFPPWTSIPPSNEFLLSGGQSFVDEHGLPISPQQRVFFEGWKRPAEILTIQDRWPGISRYAGKASTRLPIDLVQDGTNDCSVVASLCVLVGRQERKHDNLIPSMIHPWVGLLGESNPSQNGKYVFMFYFNGTFRSVVIDDRLPLARLNRSIFVVDRSNPSLLWPALVEKAYLKVRGGYDFPGSNSGTDVWILTGWIPEQIFLQRDSINQDKLWTRILGAFKNGNVLITAGTGTLSEPEEEGTGLTGEHDYAVLDLRNVHAVRSLLIKDPWAHRTTWMGTCQQRNAQQADSDAADMQPLPQGSFWMDLKSFCTNFESLYLNWNPSLFSFRQDLHCTWEVEPAENLKASLGSNPQFTLRSDRGGVVWILLQRHFESSNRGEETSQIATSARGYISLYAFRKGGQKVVVEQAVIASTPFVDSPNALLQMDVAPQSLLTIVVIGQQIESKKLNLSISALGINPCMLEFVVEKYAHRSFQEGIWDSSRVGGCSEKLDSGMEFKYILQLPHKSALYALLESDSEGHPIRVRLLQLQQRQSGSPEPSMILGDSGMSRNGPLLIEFRGVAPGTYAVICSTERRDSSAHFKLEIGCQNPYSIKPALQDNAGRLISSLPVAKLCRRRRLLSALISLCDFTRLFAGASWSSDSPFVLRLAIEHGQRPFSTILVVGTLRQEYAQLAKVMTRPIDVQPSLRGGRRLFVTLEAIPFSGIDTSEVKVDVQLISDGPLEVGPWTQVDVCDY